MDQLPDIYQAIKGLDIGRDEFTRVNAEWIAFNEEHGTGQSTYTDEQIEYMFGGYDENEIKQKLKQVTTYYYEGRLYTVYELMKVDADLFNEMIESGGLEEFAVSIEKYVQEYDLGDVRRLQKRIRDEGANSEVEDYLWRGDLDRHYPDNLWNTILLAELRTWDEINAWSDSNDDVPYEEKEQLPYMYQAVKWLNISREDFVRVNEEHKKFNAEHSPAVKEVYTDEQIEYMFGDYDENEIKQKLKKVTTYYYNGRVYTVDELVFVDDALFNEMIEKGGLEDYSVLVEKYANGDLHYVRMLQKRIRGEDITDE